MRMHVNCMHGTVLYMHVHVHMHMACCVTSRTCSHTEQVRARSMHELNVGTPTPTPPALSKTAADEEIDEEIEEIDGDQQPASLPPNQSTRPVSTTGPGLAP